MYTEPNPYNPPGNLRPGDAAVFTMDLTDRVLPRPRLSPVNGVIQVAVLITAKQQQKYSRFQVEVSLTQELM
jgi:hypothetical protein